MDESFAPSNLMSDSEPDSEIHFSPFLTVMCLLVCLCGLALLLWSVSSSKMVLESVTASRDLERLASRLLEFESRLSDLSTFERGLFRLWGEDGATQAQIRQWYAELPHERRTPLDELYAGILDGEAELKTHLKKSMQMWSSETYPFPAFRQLLDVGYLGNDTESLDYEILHAQLAEEVPANWFYYQLAERLASQSGDQALQKNLQRQFQLMTDPQLWKWRVLVMLELTLAAIGFFGFMYEGVLWFKQRAVWTEERCNPRKSPWAFREGVALLVRGGALSIILIGLLAILPYGVNLLEDYGSLLLYLPTVVLAMLLLCRPKNQSLLELLGCHNVLPRLRSSLPLLLSVIALGLLGEWLIMLGSDLLDMSVHWTEWFLPQLVWGSQADLLKTTMEVIVLAPIFEEIIFRGIVFSTLRAKFGFPVSMIGSAMIFAVAHGYGPIAFLTVFWSGLLWAWLYERTGSVIPGICAHAINNGLVISFLVAFFR
jgi:membrane protease YdiL (CAAX protease family)